MKKYFIVSLCKNGILGGGISVSSTSICYHTNKLTVPSEYKNIEMKYEEIISFSSSWLFIFPTVTIKMNDGKEYKFIVFAKKAFLNLLNERCVNKG